MPYIKLRSLFKCKLPDPHSSDVEAWIYLPGFLREKQVCTEIVESNEQPVGGSGFPGGSAVKEPPASARDMGSIPGSGRSSGGGNGNPLQDSSLGNHTDREAWRATVHRVTKSQTQWHAWHAHKHMGGSTVSLSLHQNHSQVFSACLQVPGRQTRDEDYQQEVYWGVLSGSISPGGWVRKQDWGKWERGVGGDWTFSSVQFS